MGKGVPYRVASRRCYYSAPHRHAVPTHPVIWAERPSTCRGTAILWPEHFGGSTPTCEAHARFYYGDAHVDKLVAVGAIKVWKLSSENPDTQGVFGNERGNNGITEGDESPDKSGSERFVGW